MLAITSLLVVVSLSLLITRIATILLVHTGLSRESARFQARSAFTGVGFTTEESERVVNHPVRRRVLMALMLLGNAGIITAMSSLMLTFVDQPDDAMPVWMRLLLLVAGISLLWAVSMSQWVDVRLSRLIEQALARYTRLDVQDYASLLHLTDEYRVTELLVEAEDWIAGKTMREAQLRDEGINVLAIVRADGTFEGTVGKDTHLCAGDTLILYGHIETLAELDERRNDWRGDLEHRQSVAEHEREIQSTPPTPRSEQEEEPTPQQ